MATAAAIAPRTMTEITQALQIARIHFATLRVECIGRTPTAAQDARWTAFEQQIEALEQEFCSEMHRLTGVSWSRAATAMDGVA